MNATEGLTDLESQRYDRQIRVWGAEAQSRIQTSKVLVCGLSGLNTEVLIARLYCIKYVLSQRNILFSTLY